MDIRAAEISDILKSQIANFGVEADVSDVGQVLSDPQVLARNMVVSVDDPAMAGLRLAGNPIKLSGHADPATRAAAPALDADRERLLDDF